MSATILFTGMLFTSCNSQSEKVENAEDNVLDAKKAVIKAESELSQTRQDSITDFQQFKTKYQNQISANEKSIADLRSNIEGAIKENKASYEKKVAELEEKNNALKTKLNDYNEEKKNQWQSFKTEFKRDMDELGEAFSAFTINSNN
ncbi:MAG: hypothetical protein ACQETJ_13995 [Bacteroidota bacterium]